MKPNTSLCRLAPVAALLVVAGCSSNSSAPTDTNAASPAPVDTSAPASTEASEKSYTGAPVTPPKGFGNAQGRVMWNGKPAAGILVRLCDDIGLIGGCSGKTYSAKTDKDGNFTVDKVPPGDYAIAVQIFDTDMFLYKTAGIISAKKFHIDADKTLDLSVTNLYKLDLQVLSPKAGETVKTGLPKLSWKAYPGATEYEVYLSAKGSSGQTLKSAAPSVTPDTPLLNGAYEYTVKAKTADGTEIAETHEAVPFKVTGQAGSTKLTLLTPKSNAVVPAGPVVFSWEKHPLADGYQIYLNAANGTTPILSYENVPGTTYTPAQTLAPGQYFWNVQAMSKGQKVADADLQSFTVK